VKPAGYVVPDRPDRRRGPRSEPVTVQRRGSSTGVVVVCRQKVALGRAHRHQTVTIHVAKTILAVEVDVRETRIVRRTTTLPVRKIKARPPQRSHRRMSLRTCRGRALQPSSALRNAMFDGMSFMSIQGRASTP
jgi:hypothetical protein